MAKYKIGQKFKDKDDGAIYTIIGVSPKLNYEQKQTYWAEGVEVVDGEECIFYFVYSESFFDDWTDLTEEKEK